MLPFGFLSLALLAATNAVASVQEGASTIEFVCAACDISLIEESLR